MTQPAQAEEGTSRRTFLRNLLGVAGGAAATVAATSAKPIFGESTVQPSRVEGQMIPL